MDSREIRWSQALRLERQGERESYESFLKDFADSVRRIVKMRFRLLNLSPADAEDVVQEVLIAVHSKRRHWTDDRPLLPWLNAVTRYKLIDAVRRLRRDALRRCDLTDYEWANLFAADDPALHRDACDVDRLIDQLPTGQQSVVRALGVDGDTPKEAAVRLGISEGAVRVAFHRSLKRLAAMRRRFVDD